MTVLATIDESIMAGLPRRSNKAVVLETLKPSGKRIVDVGCGDGALTRLLARAGASVTGVECGAAALAQARTQSPVADETYVEGVGQNLPFEDSAFDAVVYFNVLHHVPVADRGDAIVEATRVLKPGGMLYVNEPIAQGSSFDLNRLVEDETEVRQAAYDALRNVDVTGLRPLKEYLYLVEIAHPDFESYRARSILTDERRRTIFDANDAALRNAFAAAGIETDRGRMVEQPMRLCLFEKAA